MEYEVITNYGGGYDIVERESQRVIGHSDDYDKAVRSAGYRSAAIQKKAQEALDEFEKGE